MLRLYLDTSALLKRYVVEPGTETIDEVFGKAETGELTITLSLWNIGEAIGVLDEKLRKGWLTKTEFDKTLNLFADEITKLLRLKTIEIIPAQTHLLTNTWELIMPLHIYEADALQITTCTTNKNYALLTDDEKLAQTGKQTGLNTIHVSKEERQLRTLLQNS